MACFFKNSISYNQKPNFCINTNSIFTEIFLPKSKPVLIGILYWLLYKCDFVNCLERTFNGTNVIESHDCYVLSDININLQHKDKESFKNRFVNTINKEIPHLTRISLEFCFTRSLEQIITRPTKFHWSNCHRYWSYTYKLTWQSQSFRRLSDHDLIYCTKKISLPKSHEHSEIFICSMKNYFAGKSFGNFKRDCFPKLSDLYLCKRCLLRFYV